MTTLIWRRAAGVLVAGAVLCLAGGTALAQASGDGRMGPRVFGGTALDQSLHALNHVIQDKYAQEDRLAALIEEQQPEFATAARASAAAPVLASSEDPGAFGYLVSDDRSLNAGLALFNIELALRGDDLFIQVVRAATAKGEAFSMAARSAGLDAWMARWRAEFAATGDGFGDTIAGDASLEANVAALNRWMIEQELRESRLAAAVPPVDGSRFDSVMIAMALSY